MTNPDYRALCAELVELCTPVDSIPQLAERLQKLNALADRARTLLAEADGPAVPDGREPATVALQPSDGEVAELVEFLREQVHACLQAPWTPGVKHFGRAAELLQQQAAPVPGASSTYFEFIILDGYDCTQAEGIAPTYAQALSEGQRYLAVYQQDGPHTLELRRFEVLNPDALPLPAPEETK